MSSERNRSLPDDLRALGLTVAVHNDYRLNDVLHTFWLMTLPNEDGTQVYPVSAERGPERLGTLTIWSP